MAVRANLIAPPKPANAPLEFIQADAERRHPDFRAVHAPALTFFVINKVKLDPVGLKWYGVFETGYKDEQIENVKREVKRGDVVVLRDTDHFFFVDPNQIDDVVGRIRDFLSQP